MDVSVIFAIYNRGDILESVFESWRVVQVHTKYTFEIIGVIEDGLVKRVIFLPYYGRKFD